MPLYANPEEILDGAAAVADAQDYAEADMDQIGAIAKQQAAEEAEFRGWFNDNLRDSDVDEDLVWSLYWGCPSSWDKLNRMLIAVQQSEARDRREAHRLTVARTQIEALMA